MENLRKPKENQQQHSKTNENQRKTNKSNVKPKKTKENSCTTYNNYPDNIADYHGKLYQKVDNFFEELQEKEGLLTFNSSCQCVRKSCLIW